MLKYVALAMLCVLLLAAAAQAQIPSGKLVFTIPGLYGPTGLTLPNPFHQAHFNSSFQSSFTPLNAEIGSELSRLPLASPASGFVYTFDKALGVWTQTNQSFGPILSERSETIGRHKFFVGFGYQRFDFDNIDGIDIHHVPAVFGHIPFPGDPLFERDYITTDNDINMVINQYTLFATFGLTNRVDVSVAVPIEDVSFRVTSRAHINRIAPPDPIFGQAHFFDPANPNGSIDKTFTSSGSASGIGDVVFRGKATVWKGERAGLAAGLDLRVPSGDELNFLGSGAVGVKPFLAFSYRARVSPHANIGYEWNGDSVLAGNAVTGVKDQLPGQFLYSGGVDVGLHKRVTAVFDIIGQRAIDTDVVRTSTFTAFNGAKAPSISVARDSVNILNASVGLKVNPFKHLLINGNALIKLNDGGLRANVVPYVGLSYVF